MGILKFCPARSPDNGIPGSMSSAVTDRRHQKAGSNHSRHEIEYRPWMRHFVVTFHPAEQDPQTVYIPEHNVQVWYPLNPKQ